MRFIFCDKVLEIESQKRIVATKTVSILDEYLVGHYAKRPVVPVPIIIECVAQAAGWLVQYSYGFHLRGVLTILEGVKIHQHVQAGTVLTIEAHLARYGQNGSTVRGIVKADDELVLEIERLAYAQDEAPTDDFAQQRRKLFDYVSGGYPLPEEIEDAI